jgi:DNA polymerase-3 subunit epsilon
VVRSPGLRSAIGPFRARSDAADTAALLARFLGIRTCTNRLGRSAQHGPACPEREVAPCPASRDVDSAGYTPTVQRAAELITGEHCEAFGAAVAQITALAERGHYESAARLRDHTAAAVEILWRGQRLRALAAVGELVAAQPDGAGGWHFAVIRHGQLAAAGTARRGVPPMPVVDAVCAGAQTVLPEPAPLGGALVEETALLARWLAAPGTRIVRTTEGWSSPVHAAGRWAVWAATARSARLAAEQAVSENYTDLLTPVRKSLRAYG